MKIQHGYLNFKGRSKDKLNLVGHLNFRGRSSTRKDTMSSYSNQEYTVLEKIEKPMQCWNNRILWSTIKSISGGLKLKAFYKEVIEKRVNLLGMVYDLPSTVSSINITTYNTYSILPLAITGKIKCSIVTYYTLFS